MDLLLIGSEFGSVGTDGATTSDSVSSDSVEGSTACGLLPETGMTGCSVVWIEGTLSPSPS